jgi:HK97 family phage portal protein
VLELLKRPSPFFDGCLFAEVMAKNYLVTGEAFFIGVGPITRPPLQLQPVSPANVQDTILDTSAVVAWNVTQDIYNDRFAAVEEGALSVRYLDNLEQKELQQIRNFSTKNSSMVRGQSPLVSASKEVRQHILGGAHNVSLLEKGGRLSLVFHYDEDLQEDDFNETQKRVRAQYSGADNAGKIVVSSGPSMTVTELGKNNLEMDFAELQKMIRKVVAQVYHVPLPLVDTSSQTFNNYGTAKTALYDDAVSPLAKRLYAGYGELLLPRYDLDPAKVQISFDADQVDALRTRRNEELKLRREVNVETTDELRAGLGLGDYEPNEDPGGTIMVQSSLTPLGEDPLGDEGEDIPGAVPPGQPVPPVVPVPPEEPEEPEDA